MILGTATANESGGTGERGRCTRCSDSGAINILRRRRRGREHVTHPPRRGGARGGGGSNNSAQLLARRGAVTSDGRHDPERGTVSQSSWSTLSHCGTSLDTSLTRTGTFFLNWSAAGLAYRLSHACLECFVSGLPQKTCRSSCDSRETLSIDRSRTISLTQTCKTDHVLTHHLLVF